MASSQTFTLNIKALFDASDVKAKVGDIQNAFKNIKLPDNLQKSFDTSLSGLTKALTDFETRAAKGVSSKADAKGITTSIDNVIKEFSKVEDVVGKIKTEMGTSLDLSKMVKLDEGTLNKIKTLKDEIKQLQQQISDITAGKLEQVNSILEKIKSKGAKAGTQKAVELFNKGEIDEALKALEQVKAKQESLTKGGFSDATKATATANVNAINELITVFQNARNEVSGITGEINTKTAEIGKTAQQAANGVINGATQAADALTQEGNAASNARNAIVDLANGQAQFVREVDQVKSRIQYFFGLNNAINLVKRAVRGAVDTIKDLDKAMTETAVVTDFTVSDMWKQLPDYTKRANELGVTTQAAYEAATLYYQQGLNTEEVNALSVETLKMARIAGLDAAEATDRMTNALRGFNMELDTASAQRVDDVYSELAANTASNVDEISTAMTKVASLAHSANMEFETTAAFLAQIIETTRESAETAGTALKTVVARFSEVKKLVDTNQLKGQDKEGQVVDVNKVSAALRTAGIDLNKYFLGEVGLDDIFMELASKWDSLTSVQQRYIATQAAGSRQQSRFIALMQDYARTQELVGKAYNAEGASARQFEKTQESLESKLNRLKNAWNEFLMGLTNNVMVKTVVDLLTDLLNLVNKITSAFGDGAGSILKWVVALGTLGGLRKLFTDGGLATQLIGSLMGKGLGANKLRASMGLGVIDAATQQYQPYTAEQLRGNRGTTLIGGIGNLGKGLWGGAQKLTSKIWGVSSAGNAALSAGGLIGGAEGVAAGLAGIATAGAAMAAAYGVYQLWLHNSAEGKLKLATKEAKKLQEAAQESQDQYKSLEKFQDTYQEKTAQVSAATSVADREQAILERNQAILDAIQEDGTLAQYVITERTDFGIQLTVDEAGLKAAIADISETARKAAIDAQFGEARVDFAEANVAEKNLRKLYQQQFMFAEDTQELSIDEIYERLRNDTVAGGQIQSEAAKLYSTILSERGAGKTKARIAYGEALTGFGASKELTNALMPILADVFGETQKQLSDSSLKSILKVGDESLLKIANAYAGAEDFDLENLSPGLSKALDDFAEALGISNKDLRNRITNAQKERQEIKKGRQANIFEQALRSGHGVTEQFSNIIKGLDFEKLGVISDVIEQAAGKVSDETFQSLFDTLPQMGDEQLQQLQIFFNNFSLDNPIQALDQLNSKINEVGQDASFKSLLEDIKATNAALFESSNLVQTFLLSESYEGLADSIEDATKENKKLSGKNIKEMADSCKELSTLLEELDANFEDNINSAQALADAINLIGEGSLAIDQITNSLLAALGAGTSFETMIDDVNSWIEDFDEGTDLKSGTEHIVSELESLQKYVENWEFGNEPTANIYDHIFGKDAYKKLLAQYVNDTKTDFQGLEKELTGQIEYWSGLAENAGLGGIKKALASGKVSGLSQIAGEGGEFFKWDLTDFTSTTDAITAVADALGVSKEAAEAFILSWQTHMPELRTEWNDLQLHDAITAFTQDLGNGSVVTQQELDALAAQFGKDANEIKKAIDDVRTEAGKPITVTVNWQDENGGNLSGQNLIDKFNETVGAGTHEVARRRGEAPALKDDYSKLLADIEDVSRTVKTELGTTFDTLDFDTLHNHLVDALKLTPAQATEVADHIVSETGQQFSKEIEVPIRASDGSITTQTEIITATSSESLQAGIDAAMQAANYALVAEQLAEQDVSAVGDNLGKSIEEGGTAGVAAVQSAITGLNTDVKVYITYEEKNSPPQLATGGVVTINQTRASGGVVKSYAKGSENFHVDAGTALTGEEGPELVWNKDKGYAYITGEGGPEFTELKPGDRIFNADETKKILGGAAAGGKVNAYASGGWKPSSNSGSGGSGGSGGSSDAKKESTWRNELDWLYDLMEDIAEYERQQTVLQQRYDLALEDLSSTGRDLFKLTQKELINLETQLRAQETAQIKRLQQMGELQTQVNAAGYGQYIQWNNQDQTLEINWDAIEAIQDKETYDNVTDWLDRMEKVQDQIDDANDAIWDIKKQVQELQNRYLEKYLDFQDRVMNAVVAQYQTTIDNLSELNDKINDTNTSILDSIQKEIDLERQIRDNTNIENDIADLEARLAYLQRDTTGANAKEIQSLEKQLEEARENYSDTLVDQAIDKLQQQNEAAQTSREKQIELMQAQLDYWQESGGLWSEVADLIANGFVSNGTIITGSDLWEVLKNGESWNALSEAQKKNWANELILQTNEVGAHLIQISDGNTVNSEKVRASIADEREILTPNIAAAAETVRASISGLTGKIGGTPQHSYTAEKTDGYASGGLNSQTGPALLHGTLSEPEYVLNARQTEAFLHLAEVLPSVFNGNTLATNSYANDVAFNVNVNVGSIANDYDVDSLVARIKDDLYDAASYRNGNILGFLR